MSAPKPVVKVIMELLGCSQTSGVRWNANVGAFVESTYCLMHLDPWGVHGCPAAVGPADEAYAASVRYAADKLRQLAD